MDKYEVAAIQWTQDEQDSINIMVDEVTDNYQIYTLAEQGRMFEAILGSWYFRRLLEKYAQFHGEADDYLERFYSTLRAKILEVSL